MKVWRKIVLYSSARAEKKAMLVNGRTFLNFTPSSIPVVVSPTFLTSVSSLLSLTYLVVPYSFPSSSSFSLPPLLLPTLPLLWFISRLFCLSCWFLFCLCFLSLPLSPVWFQTFIGPWPLSLPCCLSRKFLSFLKTNHRMKFDW